MRGYTPLEEMVRFQIERRGIRDERILNVFREVKREYFVPSNLKNLAYEDNPLPIGDGQTISQPYMVALMTQVLNPQADERILEIGTGSGWQAAILSCLSKEVYTVERIPSLADSASQRFRELGYKNIFVKLGDGTQGWEEFSPYDGIIVTCASPFIPPPLISQVKIGGRIVIPVGGRFSQDLILARREDKDRVSEKSICGCMFVPLIGKYGYKS